MDDEQKQLKAVTKSTQADWLLSNPAFHDAMQAIEQEVINAWKNSKTPEERDRAWSLTKLLERIPEYLRLYVTNGKMAKAVLEDIQAKRRKAA